MKPKEKKPEIVYRIVDKETGNFVGSYSRSCCDEYDFGSAEEARNANCNGEFLKPKYKVAKYKVTYELIEDDENDETIFESSLIVGETYRLKHSGQFCYRRTAKGLDTFSENMNSDDFIDAKFLGCISVGINNSLQNMFQDTVSGDIVVFAAEKLNYVIKKL
jgi:hypothetical protein